MRALLILLVLAGCGRPLTEGEKNLAGRLFGAETLSTRVTWRENPLVGISTRTYPTRPRTTCREKILPPIDTATYQARTAGITLFTHVNSSPGYYLPDYLPGYPDRMNLAAAMFFAHEMTHVWQWQNRRDTFYTPLKAGLEHVVTEDPYLFDTDARDFLDYGYEQQASLVEEYLCCATLDPEGARTERLRALVSQALPIRDLPQVEDVRVPYAGSLEQICS